MKQLYPNLFFFLCMLNIFPLSVACVERLFLRMKLIKTCLKYQLSQVRLNQFLRIATELHKDGYDNNVYEYFDDELKHAKTQTRA